MKELIRIFQNNRTDILNTLLNELKLKEVEKIQNEHLDKVFLDFSALETVYAVDENFVQVSPIFTRREQNSKTLNQVKINLKENTHLESKSHFMSLPYVSEKTHKYVVTLVKKIDDRLIAFDFDLYKLLKEMKHTNFSAKLFIASSKIIYGIIGISLALFSMILVFYAIYDFSHNIYTDSNNIFELIFKSTIGITLGLAII